MSRLRSAEISQIAAARQTIYVLEDKRFGRA
jgi:hypothetical protein